MRRENEIIKDVKQLGVLVRQRRKAAGLTQTRTADFAGVGLRFLGELERGKPTMELGRVLRVLDALGLEVVVSERGLPR